MTNKEEIEKINNKLIEVLSQEKGYFGRVNTLGQRPTNYEFIGYELDTDFLPTLQSLSEDKRKRLVEIVNYFDIHASSLKKMLDSESKKTLYDFYSEWAWSHFMTVIMFGMLEVGVRHDQCAQYNKQGYLKKFISINKFLETYLPQEIRDSIAERYKTKNNTKLDSFSTVIKHLWDEIRSGFIHEAGVYYKGMEWSTFSGLGFEGDPITIEEDVPMQELLQITWQAILNSFEYRGVLKLPKYKPDRS
jgi:hypothetical protein